MIEVLVICIIVFTFGLSIGAISIASAENYDADVTEIIYNAGYEAGYEKGKADEQKRVMQKLEEYERNKKRAI